MMEPRDTAAPWHVRPGFQGLPYAGRCAPADRFAGRMKRSIAIQVPMKFCSNCGAQVDFRIPAGDALPRHVCARCGTIHYQNPKLVVGALAEWEDRILLCRRAIEPRHGMWTLPAGFMENGESTAQAATRETLEEACARIELGAMYTLIDVPHISQVHIIYRARLLDLDFRPGEESLDVALFEEKDIPWEQIAFRTIALTLHKYFEDRRRGEWPFHSFAIGAPPPEPAPKP